MPTLVRKLNNFNTLEPVGVDLGEPQADALKNFNTTNNNLSVYEVANVECDAERLAIALAANTERLDKVDFVVFDCQLATKLDIPIKPTKGKTPDQRANDRHRDLQIETSKRLCDLTEAIVYRRLEVKRLLQFEVKERIVNAIKNGSIDPGQLKKPMREALEESHPGITKGGS